jgi:O-antigen/teichoic acid export membrane protein
MKRAKLFLSGLLSSYLAMAINVVFTIGSVPLALHYLTKEEFGIWALITQITGYLMLIELGMSGSVARFLADHKDDVNGGVYGDILKTGSRVFLYQGLIVMMAGAAVAFLAPGMLDLNGGLREIFAILMFLQAVVAGMKLATGTLSSPLWSHQRLDISNLSNCLSLVANFGGLWLGFLLGWKLYSLLAASILGSLASILVNYVACTRLGFYPDRDRQGKFDPELFRKLFRFGGGLFLMNLGSQLASASQIIVVSRLLGLEAASIWAISTKVFTLAQQFVARILDASAGGLAEMVVKGERERLRLRFSHIVILSAVCAVAAAAGIALLNQPFVEIWTSGRISWHPLNDLLLALVLFVTSITRCHTGLVGLTKQIRGMKYIYLVEGIAFIAAAFSLGSKFGFSGLLTASIVCNIAITGFYSSWRSANYFAIGFREILAWIVRPSLLLVLVCLLFLLLRMPFFASWDSYGRLGAGACGFLIVFIPLWWRFGIASAIRSELSSFIQRFSSSILGSIRARI